MTSQYFRDGKSVGGSGRIAGENLSVTQKAVITLGSVALATGAGIGYSVFADRDDVKLMVDMVEGDTQGVLENPLTEQWFNEDSPHGSPFDSAPLKREGLYGGTVFINPGESDTALNESGVPLEIPNVGSSE